MESISVFRSFLQGGFECSTHKLRNGKRLDLTSATRHDVFAENDYRALQTFGIYTVREAARWHLIERVPGQYDFQTLTHILRAAQNVGTEVSLDLLHFGWPDFVHPLSADFTEQFGHFVQATVRFLKRENLPCKFIAPINEISFLAWGGGSVACINPYRQDCGPALKRSLAAAFIRASEILRGEMPDVKILAPDPAIHIAPNPHRDDGEEAVNYTLAQYEALDMIVGAREPELGGKPECLDIVGLNFYDRNQWLHHGEVLLPGHAAYKPFRQMLHEAWQRYQKPVFVSETGTEGFERASWFDYVSTEVAAAVRAGVPVEGLCLYPVVNHPGWEDDRYCENGLLDYPDEDGNRDIYGPLANAIRRQSEKFGWVNGINNAINQFRPGLSISSPLGVRFSEAAAPDDQICEVR